mmetsp:Transcript_32390/g.52400  ORF Transcript_32390/g.52400 Transcript_32390/m.52400 type:complete len:187 (-) Transcript_32390:312-872(-)|eukprot:CAMPEP_0184644184 /NCGR_PEP_ID=MMETSP0308-20130426/947_1 /TAXON_ID=38269 /ORGANISM="Gloeochaete witrockiana, Strain SAG 46.84" /LENGTH=186 /DNA_ID=CAMNT_0027072577 /DNA_START=287 /DNA_END=847 /DNA_ORIENTATION=-
MTLSQSEEQSSRRNGCGYSQNEPVDYIKPSSQDFLLLDVDYETLMKIALEMDVGYLKEASLFPAVFPVSGIIYGANHRLMINLVCQRVSRSSSARPINVIFLVDTGAPSTHLCAAAYAALIGPCTDAVVPESMRVRIQVEDAIQTFISTKNSHFSDVNVLGMDFISTHRLSIINDFSNLEFHLRHV